MDNVGYVALSNAAMLERANNVTANNIANANTDGFRAGRVLFEELITDTKTEGPMRNMSYALDKGTWSDTQEGALVQTGNALDLALQGEGWFGYQSESGQTAVGRNGSFYKSPQGDLLTASGDAVLDAGGMPIVLPAEQTNISISTDGTISNADGDILGQVGIFSAPDAPAWQRQANGFLVVPEGNGPLLPEMNTTLLQGFIESSNVNPIQEMMTLISTQRAFERTMNLANSADELRKETLDRLGRS